MIRAGAKIFLVVASLAATAPAFADGAAYETVVTGTRSETPLADAPVATEVVTRAEIEASGADDLAELLEDRAGVTINRGLFGAGIELSGLPSEYTLVLVDGQRVIGRTSGVIDLARLPLDSVERVEIVRGPASVLYGSDAIGGVVNVITRTTRRPLELEAHSSIGSHGQSNLGGRAGVASGAWSTALTGSWLKGDGWDDNPDDAATTASSWDERQATWKGAYKPSSKLRLQATADYLWRRTDAVDGSGEVGTATYDRTNVTESAGVALMPRWKPDAPTVIEGSLHFATYRDQYVLDQRGDVLMDKDEETREHIGEASLVWQRSYGSHFAVVGADGALEHLETERIAHDGDRQRLGLYAQDEWTVLREPRLVVLPAVRVDTDSQFGEHVTPRLALRWDVAEELVVRASAGQGYRAPGFKELYFFFENPAVGYEVLGNPELAPETSNSGGGGVEIKPSRWLWLGLEGQYTVLEDMIAIVTLPPMDPDDPEEPLHFTYGNIASARVLGVDARARMKGNGVSLDLAASYIWSRDDSIDLPIEGRPTWRTSASLAWMAPGGIEVDLRGVWTDSRPRYVYGDDDQVVEIIRAAELLTFDARLARAFFAGRLSGFVAVENATDETDMFQTVPPRVLSAGVAGRY